LDCKKIIVPAASGSEVAHEPAVAEGDQLKKKMKRLLDLKPIRLQGWPKHSTFRREEIYNDDGR
jgi:hypothetical protein